MASGEKSWNVGLFKNKIQKGLIHLLDMHIVEARTHNSFLGLGFIQNKYEKCVFEEDADFWGVGFDTRGF